MIGFYAPFLILQAWCLYHAYRRHSEQRWYWLILFLPGIGCAIYLYHNFSNRNSIVSITKGGKHVVNSNYNLEQLETTHLLSESITTKTNLAEAYVIRARYDDAIKLYNECLSGFMADDPALRMMLLQAYYLKLDYKSVVRCGKMLQSDKSFQRAEERIAYAWSLHHEGETNVAETIFIDMDRTFSNYKHRVEYCKFLKAINNPVAFREKLAILINEFDLMKTIERKVNGDVIIEVRELYARSAPAMG
jgi:hypothetical protein